ncbi:MAG: penicillin-binding protein 2 [Betaproteobacteria bacterium]|nr:penicillin-binding protein 2 [Betaproteobacteria bacterium]
MPVAEIPNAPLEIHRFRGRLLIAALIVSAMFLVLVGRFVHLQVFQHAHYDTLAESNRISIAPVVPNRGLILDRNGVELAHNYSAYTLEITPAKVQNLDALIDELATVVDIAPKDRKRFRKLLDESKNFESLPIRSRLSDEEVARFSVNRYRFPGVEIKARLFRQYPHRDLTAHIVGYIGRINSKEVEALEASGQTANYRGTDHIGKTGLEQEYETRLHGTTGFEQVEVDAGGRAVRTLSRTPPASGDNLVLSLDLKLQEIAWQAFGERRGALVAIEPNSGAVLAFVSKPGFDPNLFVDGIDSQSWEALNKSIDRPMTNRALQGQYPPGSTFKPFMALAGLALGKRTPEFTISDPGFYTLPGLSHQYRDWKKGGHGAVDLHRSLVISCDTYYYGLATDLGIDAIHDYVGQFGLGRKTGIDLPGEMPGILPSSQWKMRRFRQKWYAGDTVSVGIGQGYNIATPLQLAHAMAVLAANGKVYRPQLASHIQDVRSRTLKPMGSELVRSIAIKPEHLQQVRAALVDVTRPGGTAAQAGKGAPYSFAGKTGTAQVVAIKQGESYNESQVQERHRDHAWFIAYAPAENPTIALAVLVENGGHGSSAAAPIARTVLDYWLLGKLPDGMQPKPVVGEEQGD